MVDQLLRRKREELVRSWEDREKRLENARLKEKAREDRARKRRKFEAAVTSRAAGEDDEGEEWMLDDWDDESGPASTPKDALTGLSKESRDVLKRMGLGGPTQNNEEDEALEEEIKVRSSFSVIIDVNRMVTPVFVDLLYVQNTFPALAVHHGAAATKVSSVAPRGPL